MAACCELAYYRSNLNCVDKFLVVLPPAHCLVHDHQTSNQVTDLGGKVCSSVLSVDWEMSVLESTVSLLQMKSICKTPVA